MKKTFFNTAVKNLRSNWIFAFSMLAFLLLNAALTAGYCIGLVFAAVIAVIICAKSDSFFGIIKKQSKALKIVSLLTALGISLSAQQFFYTNLIGSQRVSAILSRIPSGPQLALAASFIGAGISLLFTYLFAIVIWSKLTEIFSQTGLFKNIKTYEKICLAIIIAALICFMAVTFLNTDAFYGTEYKYDVIYTSDSPDLVKNNAYMALAHAENDIRQPLFAVFSMPFAAIPYLIGRILFAPPSVMALLINISQILMIFAAHFMLAKILGLSGVTRLLFMGVCTVSFPTVLFSLMMEQYAASYFWLILCVFVICENKAEHRLSLYGAGGTLVTSMAMILFMSDKSPIKKFRLWLTDMVKYGLEFVLIMLAFCRFDTIFYIRSKMSILTGFTGRTITFTDKIHQYTEFVKNCFVAPNAFADSTFTDHISWQAEFPTGICIAGIVILALCVLSTVLNRDKKSTMVAAFFALFSIVMLVFLGWGTAENGLVLYTLYFGWAFVILLFQLVLKLQSLLKTDILLPLLSAAATICLVIFNAPAIFDMIKFAITNYVI